MDGPWNFSHCLLPYPVNISVTSYVCIGVTASYKGRADRSLRAHRVPLFISHMEKLRTREAVPYLRACSEFISETRLK